MNIQLILTLDDVNKIIIALSKQPIESFVEVFNKVRNSAEKQVAEAQNNNEN